MLKKVAGADYVILITLRAENSGRHGAVSLPAESKTAPSAWLERGRSPLRLAMALGEERRASQLGAALPSPNQGRSPSEHADER